MGLNTSPNVYLLKPGKGKAPQMLYQSQSAVKQNIAKHMMFLHAMSRCDSTSYLYIQGKTKFLNTVSNYPDLEETVGKFWEFWDPLAQPTAIAAAGEKFLVALYGANHLTTSLNALR
ncbi:unnamed protein product [Psylliodes chrysocephalus]|uniref:Uncharacterized protein n=1 Tax=Psylliodes chrysocephalus TaxID=3402493 RepID=A0A9P0CKN5_9CUCU|nr:unnamed protein product [Psylliodes chrysocephala]